MGEVGDGSPPLAEREKDPPVVPARGRLGKKPDSVKRVPPDGDEGSTPGLGSAALKAGGDLDSSAAIASDEFSQLRVTLCWTVAVYGL